MTDLTQQYGETKLRDLNDPNMIIPVTYNNNCVWNRIYNLRYDLTRNLKFDFAATNTSRIDEPDGQISKAQHDTIVHRIYQFGRTTEYHHVFNINYNVPINKIPIFNWITVTARYSGTYDWLASPRVAGDSLGNTITNTNTRQLNGQFNLLGLYNKVKYLQKINNKFGNKKNPNQKPEKKTEKVFFPPKDKPPRKYNFIANVVKSIDHELKTKDVVVKVYDSTGAEIKPKVMVVNENRVSITTTKNYSNARVEIIGTREINESIFEIIAEHTLRLLMSVKNISISYTDNRGTTLPGYMPGSDLLGSTRENGVFVPGFQFISGQQNSGFGAYAASNHWLSTYQNLNSPYLMTNNNTLNIGQQ